MSYPSNINRFTKYPIINPIYLICNQFVSHKCPMHYASDSKHISSSSTASTIHTSPPNPQWRREEEEGEEQEEQSHEEEEEDEKTVRRNR